MSEPILKEDPTRFVLFPIRYEGAWDLYRRAVSNFWTAQEISFADDIKEWGLLDGDVRYFIEHILAFFASFDGIVGENLASRFYSEVQPPEMRCFYGFQIAMENIHNETYSLMIDSFITDKEAKTRLLQAHLQIPVVKKMADWAIKWLHVDKPFCERLVAFACIECILFCSPFCAIFWLKKKGQLKGLSMANELISRDETLHFQFACHIYSLLVEKCESSKVLEVITEVVDLACEFSDTALPVRLIGMNSSAMCQYIRFVADGLLLGLGYDRYYGVENPFDWMDLISMDNKSNFFERRVSEYARATKDHNGLQLLDDF